MPRPRVRSFWSAAPRGAGVGRSGPVRRHALVSVFVTVMPRTSVVEVLSCFEDEFAEFAAAFSEGEYLLWLGSGISRDVVPDVRTLLLRMLEFLRKNIDDSDPACRFRGALDEVLDVGRVPPAVRASIDYSAPVDTWADHADILDRLADRYSDVLEVQVEGEPEDFLVWEGLDVATTYGAAGLDPDVEHLCVAILMLEGVVRSAPTANWDGLVEAAMEHLVDDPDRYLRVIVAPEDFRAPEVQAELVKFHGCAVRASTCEDEYRSRLVARKSQISGWTAKPENKLIKDRLEHLFASRPALFIGLSAQDADIHIVMHEAIGSLMRSWPESPAAVVFAEEQLHHHHRHVLRVTYGEAYAANAHDIRDSALLGAYAKPTLVGLVLFTLADKLCGLASFVLAGLSLSADEIERMCADIRLLRDVVARSADGDPRQFIDALISGTALVLAIFRSGRAPDAVAPLYEPISIASIPNARANPDFPAAALGRLAIVVSLLGRGLSEGHWRLEAGSPSCPRDGALRVATPRQTCRLFVVRGARSHSQLEVDGVVDPNDEDVIVIQAEATQSPTTRSPRARYGRTGTSGARTIDLEEICATVDTASDLFEAFRLEGAL